MQWNRCYPCHHDIELAIIHSILARSSSFLRSLCLCTFAFCCTSIATMFAHLCLQLRSSTASWCRASFVSQRSLCGNASDLSLSLYLFPLFLSVVARHMSSDALYQIFSSWSILLFTSCLSIAHKKFTNKIHQLFTDYLLRLPYSELLETHLFRSRANRRLVCNFYCIFPGKGLPHFCHTKVLPRNIAARLPQVYHGKIATTFAATFAPLLGRKNAHFLDEVYHKVCRKVYHRMAVDISSIFAQKCKGFNPHLGSVVDSVVF